MDPFKDKKALRAHLVEITKELVRFPSHVGEPLRTFELMEYIKSYFANDRVFFSSHTFGGFPSLFIRTQDTNHPRILLSGHVDIVQSSAQYTVQEIEGKLMGSGTMDMKGGIACMLAIMKYFCEKETPPSIGLMITSDEEIGGANGTEALLKQQGYGADFVIINEGREKYEMVTREKGILILKFTDKAHSVHSAYPWRVENPLEELMSVLLKIRKIFPKAKDSWITTASVTTFHSGKETNTIPAASEAYMNIRLIGGSKWSRDVIMDKIRKQLPKHIEINEVIFGETFIADLTNPYLKLLRKTVETVSGARTSLGQNHGASDARFFMTQKIPCAILGPVGHGHHTPDEYVEIESLTTHFQVLKKFIEDSQAV